jgi:hypothetical protein
MMMQLNPLLSPLPAAGDLKLLAGLVELMLELIRDPKKGKALIDQLSAGATEYQQAHERVLQGQRDLNERTADFERMSTRARRELDIALETERDVVAKEHAQRRQQIDADERAARDLLARAKVDADAAAELRKTWENKFAALSKLAAA